MGNVTGPKMKLVKHRNSNVTIFYIFKEQEGIKVIWVRDRACQKKEKNFKKW
jgi:hypothetical protein